MDGRPPKPRTHERCESHSWEKKERGLACFRNKNIPTFRRNCLPGWRQLSQMDSLMSMSWASSLMAHASTLAVTSSRRRANTKILWQDIARTHLLPTDSIGRVTRVD